MDEDQMDRGVLMSREGSRYDEIDWGVVNLAHDNRSAGGGATVTKRKIPIIQIIPTPSEREVKLSRRPQAGAMVKHPVKTLAE